MTDEEADDRRIQSLKPAIDGVEGPHEDVATGRGGSEVGGALSRLEGDGVDGADDRGGGDREGELPVKLAGDAAEEGARDEDGHEDEGDADDRAEYLAHRLDRGGLGVGAIVVDVVGGVLDDHDGIIDDDADGEDQAEEGQEVDGEAQRGHADEGAEDRDGHGRGGDEHGAPVLEKHEDHDEHEDAGLEEGLVNLVDGVIDELGGVEAGGVGRGRAGRTRRASPSRRSIARRRRGRWHPAKGRWRCRRRAGP